MIKPLIQIYLDKRYLKANSTYPVKLKLTYLRIRKHYPLGYDLSEKDYNKIFTAHKLSQKMLSLKNDLLSKETKAKIIIEQSKNFSFKKFEEAYLVENPTTHSDFISLFEQVINNLRKLDRFGTADSYKSALSSLLKFNNDIKFENIDVFFLKDYENWMINRSSSKTTVGIYLRALRVVLNEAIERKIYPAELYPFGKRRYQIPRGRNIKKALPLSEIGRVYHYDPRNEKESMAKDYWFFMYLANGLNIKDLANLRYSDIASGFIIFERKKTENTVSENKKIIVHLSNEIREIIKRRGKENISPEDLIFPIINQKDSLEKRRKDYKQFNKLINGYLRIIAKNLELEGDLTCMTARHSFSTQLKRSGRSTEFIQEALGHTSPQTTQYYLDSFENEDKKGVSAVLLNFKKAEENN